MLSRENVTREALSELENQRAKNLSEEKRRRDEAEKRSTAIADLLARRQKLLFSGMRQAFAAPGQAAQISASMREQMEQMNAEIRRELINCGLDADYLQPVYRCPLCKDTGYVGEPVHEQCVCLKRAVLNRLYDNDGLQGLKTQNFETFDESIFPDMPMEGKKNTQRAYIRKIRQICEQYADGFEPSSGRGMLLYGASGLGKTFLLNCVAQRVLERGYSVVVISAYKLMETLRRYLFNGDGAEQVQDILTCDLLAIDDLGSEPMMRGVTVGSIYHVVSERHNASRPMILTTNCSVQQLYEKYEDRIAARLCDQSRMTIIEFSGTDVRRFAHER